MFKLLIKLARLTLLYKLKNNLLTLKISYNCLLRDQCSDEDQRKIYTYRLSMIDELICMINGIITQIRAGDYRD